MDPLTDPRLLAANRRHEELVALEEQEFLNLLDAEAELRGLRLDNDDEDVVVQGAMARAINFRARLQQAAHNTREEGSRLVEMMQDVIDDGNTYRQQTRHIRRGTAINEYVTTTRQEQALPAPTSAPTSAGGRQSDPAPAHVTFRPAPVHPRDSTSDRSNGYKRPRLSPGAVYGGDLWSDSEAGEDDVGGGEDSTEDEDDGADGADEENVNP
ncbi:hypothetical protein BBJ28_00026291 [Nothophytophthora sp. Chile5]|nr:hypothetical protein BBJ28_00026291 [Nothophytophthora sp. Chile5]